MSSHEQAVVSFLSNLALSFDGAVLGLAIACAAFRSIIGFTSNASVLRKLRDARSVGVSDLRSILWPDDSTGSSGSGDSTSMSEPTEGSVVIVRGAVEAKSGVDGSWKSLKPKILTSQETGDEAVVIQRTQTFIYNEWKGLFGWTSDLLALFARSWRERESITVRTVPFILTEGGRLPMSDYVFVNMDGQFKASSTLDNSVSPIANHQCFSIHIPSEKILPLGKDISAVGLCVMRNGIPEIKSCKDLPYFLNWNRWKEWRRQRWDQEQARRAAAAEDTDTRAASEDDESGNVPDGQLCVICLLRSWRSVFIPCGHLICCQHCALSVEREISPKCPVCRQSIYNSMRIYAS